MLVVPSFASGSGCGPFQAVSTCSSELCRVGKAARLKAANIQSHQMHDIGRRGIRCLRVAWSETMKHWGERLPELARAAHTSADESQFART